MTVVFDFQNGILTHFTPDAIVWEVILDRMKLPEVRTMSGRSLTKDLGAIQRGL